MTDEYKKLHANLAVLGSAIKKVEAHLAKHPERDSVVIDVGDVFYSFYPGCHLEDIELGLVEGENDIYLGMDYRGSDTLWIQYETAEGFKRLHKLSDLPSVEMIAYSVYLPELIRLADEKILELADEAENIAGEIEQALAAAAKKPERKPKAKAKA